jgi:hypothetical protein
MNPSAGVAAWPKPAKAGSGLPTVTLCVLGVWAVMDSAIASSDVLKIVHVTIVSLEREEARRDATVYIGAPESL